jgi:hypothetical protein
VAATPVSALSSADSRLSSDASSSLEANNRVSPTACRVLVSPAFSLSRHDIDTSAAAGTAVGAGSVLDLSQSNIGGRIAL